MTEEKKVTSLSEILAQAAPDVITIPGFRPGTTINVAIRPIDLSITLLTVNIGNPAIGDAIRKAQEKAGEGKDLSQIAEELNEELSDEQLDIDKMMPVIDAVCRDALVEPTYEQFIESAPLTLAQKWEIYCHALGSTELINFFRQ